MTTGLELKPIGPDIWIVDGRVIRFYGMPIPICMTVIRLKNRIIAIAAGVGLMLSIS